MRNLKRVLSLALALVMVLGMMVMTTSAATFTDAKEITYQEAVDVMSAIGVIDGIEAADGTFSFDPTATLTREQGAKIVCYLLMGKTAAEKLVGSGKFDDVKATRWSAGAIDYCASLGILDGVGDNKFDPTGKLTAVQYGKMLLCALGYDAKIEGYTGPNWATNIAVDMVEIGLDVYGVDMDAQLTREQAAEMTLYALMSDMVEYADKGSNITVGGVEIVTGAKAAEPSDKEAKDYLGATIKYNGATDGTLQMVEKYYPGLAMVTGDADAYGRPAYYKWTLYGDDVHNVQKSATYTFTVKKAASVSSNATLSTAINEALDITKASKLLSFNSGDNSYINGATTGVGSMDFEKGDVVEVFVTYGTTDITDVVIIRETAAQITNVTPNTGKATVTIRGEKVVYNYNIFIDTNMDGVSDITTTDLTLRGYTAEYVKGTYLVLDLKAGTPNVILASKVAETVVGAATAWTDGRDITIDGTKYDYANTSIVDPSSINWDYGTYEAVLGSNNQVLAIMTVTGDVSLTDIVYFTGTVWAEDTTKYGVTTGTVYAQVIDMAGVTSDIVVGYYSGANGTAAALVSGGYDSDVVSVTSNTVDTSKTAGLYSIATVPAGLGYGEYKDLTAVGTSDYLKATSSDTITADTTLKTTDKKFGTYYVTEDTVYILVTGSGATLKAKTYTGGVGYAVDESADSDFVLYTNVRGNNVAQAVVIKVGASSYTTTGAEVLFMDGTVNTVNANGYVAELYKLDGTPVDCTITTTGGKGFWTYTVNNKGAYVLADVPAATITADVDYASVNFALGSFIEDAVYSSSYLENCFNATQSGNTLADIDASNVVVVDLRSPVAKANNYNATIDSLAGLDAAASTYKVNTTTNNVVTISMFVNSNGAQVIFVTSVN